ncbi:MAG TPA: M28 family peptidase [Baekduia sp.]|uniref:M28 family metallopeptidase n=1 Tax=Baekduia sp. TaxID=2600305 RepID=UPI002C04A26C|nr:M28 family peptidase [Baekduia sp.]HMJ33253.1 M28 family peptidase [Baekduia sp.]
MAPTATEAALHADVAALSALDRLPCSAGEAEAAQWIAERLQACGARVAVDEETVHGTYFTPLGVLNGVGAAGGVAVLTGRRGLGTVLGALAAAGIWQDLTGGRKRTLRRFLKRQTTTNVVAELGDPEAAHTLVIHAHHDAARTSFIFDQSAAKFLVEKVPAVMDRIDRWPPLMGLVIGGPVAVAVGGLTGGRRAAALGGAFAAGTAAVMAHMSREPVVPGANDNLSGVAVLLEVGRRLQASPPPPGVRVILLSAGAEEANQEGMLAFARRHFGRLPVERTSFLCLDTVGSPELVLIEGEGFLRMYEYPSAQKQRVAAAARDAGVRLRRGMRLTFATDGLVPLRRGYEVASLGSVTEHLVPANYHWPTDTADNVNYATVAAAGDVVMATIARSAEATAAA